MEYILNQQEFKFNFTGESVIDRNQYHHTDLFGPEVSWYGNGYTTIKTGSEFIEVIRNNILEYINNIFTELGLGRLNNLENYHQIVQSDEVHYTILKKIGKNILSSELEMDVCLLEGLVKKKCKIDYFIHSGFVCDIRVIRPYKGKENFLDNNPLHRDTWLKSINNCINVWIPVAGCNQLSNLTLVPGSHLWNEGVVERTKSNAIINQVKYGLPAVTKINKPFKVIRPNLKTNEVLLFSSHLLHGGAINLNTDKTRVSVEIRFWRI